MTKRSLRPLAALTLACAMGVGACGGGGGSKASSTTSTTDPLTAPTSQAMMLPVPTTSAGGGFNTSVTDASDAASPSASAAPTGVPALHISPSSGRAGTSFTFTGAGFQSGETLHFQITPPGGRMTTGPAHVASPTGTVTATYSTSNSSLHGTYAVTAVGSKGSHTNSQCTVTSATTGTTAYTTTTVHHTTTTRHS